jgi:FlaA1/EpsC-like NDP-sugar epimerase
VIDVFFITLAVILAYFIRFEFDIDQVMREHMLWYLIFILIIQLISNYFSQVYNTLWRYFSLFDSVKLAISIAVIAIILVIFDFIMPYRVIPLGVIGNYMFIAFVFLITIRIVKKQLTYKGSNHKNHKVNTMIIGAGQAGIIILNELKTHQERYYNPVVFIDDDLNKVGKRISGILVAGTISDIPRCIDEYDISEAIIAIPSLEKEKLEEISKLVTKSGITPKILPHIESRFEVKPVELEDLLNRSVREFDTSALKQIYNDKVVLVTGAGGSIGSEIVRQTLDIGCKEIVLVGHGENSLYSIERDINGKYNGKTSVSVVVADVQDSNRLDKIFIKYRPNIVLHAAAHKHVPMMEANPSEAIKNNVAGTQNLANLAVKYAVERFVLVSTDKAVNPTNVMGATKRCAEVVIQGLAKKQNKTVFCAVRFGNVLGSRGSVIPVFKEQIEKGGPITVTHPEITRFFMTIPEATRLILQASSLAKGGEVFVLDMGEPIKIVDIAKKLIMLSGKSNIDIVYTGLRPGEKLYEELLTAEEGISKTNLDKIFVAKAVELDNSISDNINNLIKSAVDEDKENMNNLLHLLVPSYTGKIQ